MCVKRGFLFFNQTLEFINLVSLGAHFLFSFVFCSKWRRSNFFNLLTKFRDKTLEPLSFCSATKFHHNSLSVYSHSFKHFFDIFYLSMCSIISSFIITFIWISSNNHYSISASPESSHNQVRSYPSSTWN